MDLKEAAEGMPHQRDRWRLRGWRVKLKAQEDSTACVCESVPVRGVGNRLRGGLDEPGTPSRGHIFNARSLDCANDDGPGIQRHRHLGCWEQGWGAVVVA